MGGGVWVAIRGVVAGLGVASFVVTLGGLAD